MLLSFFVHLNQILFILFHNRLIWSPLLRNARKTTQIANLCFFSQRTWASYTEPVQYLSIFEGSKLCIAGAGTLDNRDIFISNHLKFENLLDKYSFIIISPFARLRWIARGNSGMYGVWEKWLRPSVTSFVSSIASPSSESQPIRASHMINGWEKTPESSNAISCA